MKRLIPNSVFTSFSEDVRPSGSEIPKAHYLFTYPSKANTEGVILLDVIFEENPYQKTTRQKIFSQWIYTSEPYSLVAIPTINSILGDKLAAFAPSTVGVPYWLGDENKADKRIEIIKQLHDVSLLIDHCSEMDETWLVFQEITGRQIGWLNLSIGVDEVVKDIFSAAITLAKRNKNKGEPYESRFNELQSGIIRFASYLTTGVFRIEDAISGSAKAACFSQALISGKRDKFPLFNNQIDMKEWVIRNPDYYFLNRLKKTNKPAFYYWYKCLEIKGSS